MTEIPVELQRHPNWVAWRSVVVNGKPTKVPFDVKNGQKAKANDPTTWATFQQAYDATDVLTTSEYDGPGFELGGTDIVGIDFDNAIDKKGIVDPYAGSILDLLGDPYTEMSPSRKGLHAFVECTTLPEGGRKMSADHIGIEIYHGREGGRYFTITGERVRGAGVPRIVDISLPYLLITQNKDKKFRNMWLGDTSYFDGDESSADFALMVRLAALTQNDPLKMETYFGLSGLGQRDKWTERADYRERTIKAAIETNKTGKVVEPSADIEFHIPAVPDPNGHYIVAPADGQEDGWFPLGDISLIGGASGTGKTTWVFDMLHKQKNGVLVLEHKTFKRSFHVLAYDRGQNAFERTMRRLKLNPWDIPTTPLPLAFGTDAVQNIINQIEKMDPRPEIIYLEGLDMLLDDTNKKSTVSPFMRQLQEVAAHFHIALLGSLGAPKTKRGEDYAAKRDHLSGSEAWGRNCETVAILEFTEDDDGTAPGRSLTVLPRNAAAEKFTLQFEGGKLVQCAPAEEVVEVKPIGRPAKELQKAINFLEKELQSGPKERAELYTRADGLELISAKTLDRAAEALHVKAELINQVGSRGRVKMVVRWSLDPMHEMSQKSSEQEKMSGEVSPLIHYEGCSDES